MLLRRLVLRYRQLFPPDFIETPSSEFIRQIHTMSSRLDRIRIASPCRITWEQMVGDDSIRFCIHCRLNVYNLSELSKPEAEALLASTEGRLCARLYRRSDGTVITKDCPVGLQALRRRMARTATAAFALIGSLTAVVSGQTAKSRKDSCTTEIAITRKNIVSSSGETLLTGTILDPIGAMVAGATVTLQNVRTKEIQKTISTDDGRFQFVGMTAGEYSIQIESPGFRKYRIKALKIANNEMINLKVTMSVNLEEVLVGVVGVSPNDPPGTTTITQELLRSLPH